MPHNIILARTRPQAHWDAVLTCVVTSLILNACLYYSLSPLESHPYFHCLRVRWKGLYLCCLD